MNVSINIENNQKQIGAISGALQRKLQQQSFWVNSNNPMGLDWIKAFPKLAFSEIAELTKYVSFSNVGKNLLPTVLFTAFFLLISFLLNWKKKAIKDRLFKIAGYVNTLKNDSHCTRRKPCFGHCYWLYQVRNVFYRLQSDCILIFMIRLRRGVGVTFNLYGGFSQRFIAIGARTVGLSSFRYAAAK
ncbi:potassium efflux protein KefA [Actinobacillus pleuropneumoniae]|nr:potassium efflux protein KefA [Actinobacillus pleuropneumoniae]